MSITTKNISKLTIISFLLHITWENIHAPLYLDYSSFSEHFPACFWATIGDVVFTLAIYLLISLIKNEFSWIKNLNKKDIFVIAIIGFFLATGIEWRALLLEKWSYSPAMPIIPVLKVGLTPILQMTLLLPLSFYLVFLMEKIIPRDKKKLYRCKKCDLKYPGKELAEECQAWCSKHNSCNLEIIKNAIPESEE
ncbi:MAG: hypothetical protein COU06_01000 [Candidatus Harrisonbacteria bacterium CG10_big_fil_rev_8_21_14_0_10_38_8]|uniref:Uncharacterized protein n=1 Tax=Candidatus Harrisonbacteria bacterium CG10_big_fil_rev_8_21_14_0_10_38_8 TaxID=1974582 RepID=A0A2M6WKE7_9BACT|nr:MAG: hypothetical protein COU06_01000 [Candidatus Harrisonbacteria bacterium CG10_big_fil_rev_8_21_14_0_10_38_8]